MYEYEYILGCRPRCSQQWTSGREPTEDACTEDRDVAATRRLFGLQARWSAATGDRYMYTYVELMDLPEATQESTADLAVEPSRSI